MGALEPVTDINLHFTVRKDSLRGIGTSVIDTFVADIDTSVVGTGEAVIEGVAVHTGVVGIDTSVADAREEAIEAAIVDDVNDIRILESRALLNLGTSFFEAVIKTG